MWITEWNTLHVKNLIFFLLKIFWRMCWYCSHQTNMRLRPRAECGVLPRVSRMRVHGRCYWNLSWPSADQGTPRMERYSTEWSSSYVSPILSLMLLDYSEMCSAKLFSSYGQMLCLALLTWGEVPPPLPSCQGGRSCVAEERPQGGATIGCQVPRLFLVLQYYFGLRTDFEPKINASSF